MTYLIRYIFVACVLPLTDRGRLKYRFFSEKLDFFGSGRKKFGNSDKKSDFYGSENETRKFRLRTGSPEISRKNTSLPAKTGGLAALIMYSNQWVHQKATIQTKTHKMVATDNVQTVI